MGLPVSKGRTSVTDGIFKIVKKCSSTQLLSIVRKGVKKESVNSFVGNIQLDSKLIPTILNISERTYQRYTADQILSKDQTDRVIELAKLFTKGEEVFGSVDKFRLWLNRNNAALDGILPITLLDTHLGFEIIEDELGRIEHGIFA